MSVGQITRPSQSCNLRKGVFAPSGLPKPLPLGEVALRSNDGEGKPGRKEPWAQRWAGSLSERYYRCARAVWQRPCPLSLTFARQLPQRGSPWQAGPLPTGRLRTDMAQKGGPCYRGQRLLDNAPCQAAAALDSGALLFPRHRALLVPRGPDRHASGSPFGGAVTEGD